MKVIDVSEHQGIINWEQVKGQIDGAILRVGYGDDIASQDDNQWKRNADECTRLGIPFGVYIYAYATNEAMARSEAAHVLRCIKGYNLKFPVYYDVEEPGTEGYAKQAAQIFGDVIEKAGYWCGVYANLNWWNNYLKGLERFTKWVAQYNSQCDYVGANKDMWQYTSSGSVTGINGSVDMNECYRNFPGEMGGTSGNKPTPPPTNPTPSGTKHKVGEHVVFSTCYVSSSDPNSRAIQAANMARNHGVITSIKVGSKNPYLLDNGMCWVNDGDIRGMYGANAPAQHYTIQAGDTLSGIA
ncbi:hypothetical protein DWY90_15500, partial [Coprococcus sp. AF27-8]